MTPAEFDTYCDLTEQLIVDAGPQATVADALAPGALPRAGPALLSTARPCPSAAWEVPP